MCSCIGLLPPVYTKARHYEKVIPSLIVLTLRQLEFKQFVACTSCDDHGDSLVESELSRRQRDICLQQVLGQPEGPAIALPPVMTVPMAQDFFSLLSELLQPDPGSTQNPYLMCGWQSIMSESVQWLGHSGP